MKKETEKFARNIKTEAEFPNSQRNMLYRKRAFSGSCAAQQQTEKIRTEYKNGKTAMEEPPGCLLHFCCFFFVFPCGSQLVRCRLSYWIRNLGIFTAVSVQEECTICTITQMNRPYHSGEEPLSPV